MNLGSPGGAPGRLQAALDNAQSHTGNSSKPWLESFLGDNPYFQAGFGLMVCSSEE
ncbi:hypothetical protein E1B28_008975 [Marasmius oreades]|uniref:Uncharacterized protein n=1 Tax=Marasmius oreades TaxID=181124 RepID=A0A9P7S014_9AGAR|nr:uncharacterized protein E1B28_008975 [Marasmius oreades]KAG7092633.1 hypothetical protein E1B28_008975 [Marasmius oreades]